MAKVTFTAMISERSKNLEKIKDLLYYLGDFIIGLLILSLMYLMITWKLDETMPVELNNRSASVNEQGVNSGENKTVVVNAGVEKEGSNRPKEEKKDVKTTNQDKNTKENKTQNNETEKQEQNTENKSQTDTVQETVSVTVESGMSGVDIAYMLEEQGVIESADLFVAKLQSMELSESLLAGTFELKKGMSYADIVKVLAGQ